MPRLTLGPSGDQTITTAYAPIVPDGAYRRGLILQNTGSNNIRIGPSEAKPGTAIGIQIVPGQTLVFDETAADGKVWYAITETGTSTLMVCVW
jgi:hypothetical protein